MRSGYFLARKRKTIPFIADTFSQDDHPHAPLGDLVRKPLEEIKLHQSIRHDGVDKLKAVKTLELLVRNINKGYLNNKLLNNAERHEIKSVIEVEKSYWQQDETIYPRVYFIGAVLEERLGRGHAGNALAMYKKLENDYPQFRRAYNYHLNLLFSLGKKADCEELLKKFQPSEEEIKYYPHDLQEYVAAFQHTSATSLAIPDTSTNPSSFFTRTKDKHAVSEDNSLVTAPKATI